MFLHSRIITLYVCFCLLLSVVMCGVCFAEKTVDPRFAVSGPFVSYEKMDEMGARWHHNWHMRVDAQRINNDYPLVRIFWRTMANQYTDEELQSLARTVREVSGPDAEIWWAASNEPNERGQANQTPQEFADGYYQFHRNIKIGDPDAKILGPGLLNWTFQNSAVWKSGKAWYEEFREVWSQNPTYAAYSESIQGNPYPPMDAFNLHTYDLRGDGGSPYEGPPDWHYLKNETLACYADLQTYPETKNLKIWNTEYGSLRATTLTESADTLGGIALWFREQPFMERWFFFLTWAEASSRPFTMLLDGKKEITSLGRAHHALSTMGDTRVYNIPFNDDYSIGKPYTRDGTGSLETLPIHFGIGVNFVPEQGVMYTKGDTKGITYTVPEGVVRLTFNYRIMYNPAWFQLEIDVPTQRAVWSSGTKGLDQWADIDLSQYDSNEISFVLHCIESHKGLPKELFQITNITFWFD